MGTEGDGKAHRYIFSWKMLLLRYIRLKLNDYSC